MNYVFPSVKTLYLFSVVVAASLCRGAQRAATRTATQRRGYNPADAKNNIPYL